MDYDWTMAASHSIRYHKCFIMLFSNHYRITYIGGILLKKILGLFLIGYLLICATPTQAKTFSDVPANSELQNALTDLQKNNVISGYDNGTFRPNNHVTRGQLAKMIAVSLKLQPSSDMITFSDLPNNHANYPYVQALVAKKIVNGYPDGTFKPNQVVTRSQAAKMIAAAFNIPAYNAALPFKDVTTTSDRYKDIQALYFNGITGGTTSTTFSPSHNVTRGQAALFIYRASSLKNGAVIKEVTLSESNSVEIIAQDGNFYKTVTVGNKIRILPLSNGSGLIFVKHANNYTMHHIQVSNKRATTTVVDWHNYIQIKFNYYTLANLQLTFTPTKATVRDSAGTVLTNDNFFFAANNEGVELALLSPGNFTITLANENGQSQSYTATSFFEGFTLKFAIYN